MKLLPLRGKTAQRKDNVSSRKRKMKPKNVTKAGVGRKAALRFRRTVVTTLLHRQRRTKARTLCLETNARKELMRNLNLTPKKNVK